MDSFLKEQLSGYALLEDDIYIDKKARLRGFFAIGHHSSVQAGCWIHNVLIGNYSRIEKRVQLGYSVLYSGAFSNHYFAFSEGKSLFNDSDFDNLSTDRFFYQKIPISYIGNDVRICDQSIIYAGVSVGDGAVIYPNSVVTEDVEPYTIVAGNPAVKIGDRFDMFYKQRIINLDWTNKDFSKISSIKRLNYLDLDTVLDIFESFDLSNKVVTGRFFNSYNNEIIPIFHDIAIIGPSHIYNWLQLINRNLLEAPKFLLYGEPGLSVFSLSFKHFIKWWIKDKKKKVIFMVPDARIGNSSLVHSNDDLHDKGLFISKEQISSMCDKQIYCMLHALLLDLVKEYGDDIKFLFWCLYGREQTNISQGNYVNKEGVYKHPFWNYKMVLNDFSDNIIDISELGDGVLSLIEPDGSIHPNIDGYKYIEHMIGKSSFV